MFLSIPLIMTKTIIVFLFLTMLFAARLSAQSPAHINYQAALRNTETDVELSNQQVFLVVKFLNGGPAGDIVYQEEHYNVSTSLYGIINVQLGEGEPVLGSFGSIPWSSGNIWLDLEVDAGKGLESIGTTKFSSVPYALYATDAPNSEPDGDGDSTNEIQDLYFENNVLTISNNENATPIDFSGFVNAPDADSDPSNELITAFQFNPNTAVLSITEGGLTHIQDLSSLASNGEPDADSDPTNEIQDLNLSDHILTVTGNPEATEIDLSVYENIPNLDNDPANEIQDLELSGTTLRITGNTTATDIDLSGFSNVPNLDNDPANEIQDLSFSNHVLSITGNASATDVDLSQYQNPSLPQGQIFVGNASNVAEPLEVSGDVSMADDGNLSVVGLRDIPISTTAPTDGQVLSYNATNNMWEPVNGANVASLQNYYSVDPMDFVELHNPGNQANLNAHNSIKFFNEDAPFAMVRDGNIRTIGTPIHLPHGAVINQIRFYIRDLALGVVQYKLLRKEISNFQNSNLSLASGTTYLKFGNLEETLSVNSNNVVNNQLYTYRVVVTFSVDFDDDEEDTPSDILQAVYGVVVRYTN